MTEIYPGPIIKWMTEFERFWRRVEQTDGCWFWHGATRTSGYGVLKWKGRFLGAHVVSWIIANEQSVPVGRIICHSCDIKNCVRPSHLFAGTPRENMLDHWNKHPKLRRAKSKSITSPHYGGFLEV